jgi:oligoendopeptidase F
MHPTTEPRRRDDIPAEYRWDFTPIFADWTAWEAALAELQSRMDAFAARKGSLAGGAQALLDAYRAFDDIGRRQYLVYRYPQLQRDVDMADQTIAAHFQRVSAVFARFHAATAWFTPELLSIPEPTVRAWIDATPELAPYRFPILDQYRRQAHVLDEAGERLLALASPLHQAPGRIFQELSTTDIVFPTVTLSDGQAVQLTPATYHALLEKAPVQADRATAAAAFVGTYGKTAHTYAAIYNGVLQRDWALAQSRRFGSTLEAALHDDAIPTAVVETLIEATRAGSAPLQRYLRLRQRMLGLERYHLYDGFAPLVRSDRTYPYETARELTLAAVAPLGAGYVERYRRFVAGGRIDVYESAGKRAGAYSAGVYGVGPYQLLNYNDTLDAVFTFAHEGGHAMHTVLSHEHQPFATSDYTIFVAEVASTTNERFLLEHMMAHETDPRERFGLLQHAVDQIVSTFYVQVLFADFELQAHRLVEQGQPVTTEVLDALYLRLLGDCYGDAVEIDDFYRWTWARIPHFYNSPYYVYQYATCFASSAQLFAAMTTGDAAARRAATDRYLALLSSGGNDHPMQQLEKAGVDLTRRETVQAVIDELDTLVARMEVEAARFS